MSIRSMIVMGLGTCLGLVAAVAVYVATSQPPNRENPDLVDMVVAAQNLTARSQTSADAWTTRQVRRDLMPPGALGDVEKATGRTLRMPLKQGDVLLEPMLVNAGVDAITELIPDGHRAFSIRVVDSSAILDGLIQPSSHVDVLLTLKDGGSAEDEQNGGAMTRTILQNVEVFALGKQIEAHRQETNTDRMRSVTLLVTPDQANDLQLGQNQGSLHLTLRGKDTTIVEDERSDLRQLRGDNKPSTPSTTPAPLTLPPIISAKLAPEPAPLQPTTITRRLVQIRGTSQDPILIHYPLDSPE